MPTNRSSAKQLLASQPSASPTSTKAQKTHAKILSMSLKVFAREGFANTDVQVIADLAGVGKGTVYRHFGNKEQLFLATAKFSLEQVAQFVTAKLGGQSQVETIFHQQGAASLLRSVAQACAEYYKKHPQAVEIMIQERAQFRESVFPTHLMHREQTRGSIDDIVARAIQSGEFRLLNAAEVTTAYADLLYGCVVNGCLEGSRSNLKNRVTVAVDIFIAGLCSNRSV